MGEHVPRPEICVIDVARRRGCPDFLSVPGPGLLPQPELGFVLHSTEYSRSATVTINAWLSMTANREIFRDLATGKGPAQSLVAFGYSGWGPGQLEGG